MKGIYVAIGVIVLTLGTGASSLAKAAESEKPEYTNAQIKKMAREAHTVEQYSALADYYATQRRLYEMKAVEMMQLWAQRNEMYYRVEKWPRPVDSARNLHDYYEYKAAQSAALFAKYDRLADAAAATNRR